MPQLQSSKKSLRQSLKRRDRNRGRKKAIKLAVRAATDSARTQDATAAELLSAAQKAIDKAARSGAIHKKTADRRKSRLMRRINSLAGA
jgi:small subunit ribosomal protein S20